MFYKLFALSAQDMNFVYAAQSSSQRRAVNQSDKAVRSKRVPMAAHHSVVFRQDWESTLHFSFGSVVKKRVIPPTARDDFPHAYA